MPDETVGQRIAREFGETPEGAWTNDKVLAAARMGPIIRGLLAARIDAAVAEARAEEREACAKVAENARVKGMRAGHYADTHDRACQQVAAAIRARR